MINRLVPVHGIVAVLQVLLFFRQMGGGGHCASLQHPRKGTYLLVVFV